MWQSNVSWKEGFFSKIPFERFQEIKTTQWDSPLAIFTRVNPRGGDDWPNLRLEGIQSSTSPTIRRVDTLFSPDYYIIAIDTRIRTSECSTDIKTQDNISGKVLFTLEYQASVLGAILNIADPLQVLKDRIQEAVQDACAYVGYRYVTTNNIKTSALSVQTEQEIGIAVRRVSNIRVSWPETITKTLEQITVDSLLNDAQKVSNDQKIQKLQEFGITDPVLYASVLSQTDADFAAIMDHVRGVSKAYQDQAARDKDLLAWLAEKDYISRADVQKIIGPLTDRINDHHSVLLSSAPDNRRALPNSDEQANSSEQSSNAGPQIVRKRRVNTDE